MIPNTLKVKLFFLLIIAGFSFYHFDAVFIQTPKVLNSFGYARVMVVAICFGVIGATALYNLMFFFYLKSREHLYYALAQIFTLVFLMHLDSIFIAPFDQVLGWDSWFLFHLTQLLMLLFSLLFIQSFLEHYQNSSLVPLIKVILLVALIDFFILLIWGQTFFTKLVPIFILIALVLSEAYRTTEKKDIPFYYLFVGWGLVLLVVALEYVGFVKFTGWVFPFLQVALALDSLLLSFAISYKFKLMEEQRQVQQTLLLQQSRLASMGEMISIVAHQWRQPLNYLAFSLMHIKKKTDNPMLGEVIENSNLQLQYMSDTIDNFRAFYSPSKYKELFSIEEACKKVIKISSLDYVVLEVQEDFEFYGNANEFEQVILNIMNNAKDIFVEKEISKPKICIRILKGKVEIEDNAGGIESKLMEKIFEPYFSTKKGNDGIGLYIAKLIIESEMQGKLSVKNGENGAIFTLYIN